MSDIQGSSENVKDVFRKSLISRTSKWLETKTFTNEELLEILHLCEFNEQNKNRSKFYDILILSQTGPFKPKIFEFVVGRLSDGDALLHLLQNSGNLTDEQQVSWLISVVKTSPQLTNSFVLGGGIDIESTPINHLFAHELIRQQKKIYDLIIPTHYSDVLKKTITSLTRDEFSKWFKDTNSYHKDLTRLLLMDKNMHENMLNDLFNMSDSDWHGHWITKHENCPDELKIRMFEKTDDPQYLPQEVQDIFVF